jgi:hypothetical protein
MLPRKPGEWESFDVTLVGRTVTVVRDGTLTIDHKEIDGITGGALDDQELCTRKRKPTYWSRRAVTATRWILENRCCEYCSTPCHSAGA